MADDESAITATRYFEIQGDESNQSIHEQTTSKKGNQLSRQFNCSMTYVQCTLYRRKPAPGEHTKNRRYFLKMESRADICIKVQIKDAFLSGIQSAEIESLPAHAELVETYGSP